MSHGCSSPTSPPVPAPAFPPAPLPRPAPRRRLLSAVLVLALGIVAGTLGIALHAPPVAAQGGGGAPPPTPTPAPGSTEVRRWGISPAAGGDGVAATTSPNRPWFTYELAPGSVVRDAVTLWNYTDQPLVLRSYARDAFNNPAGALDLLAADKQNADVGRWVQLDNEAMEVPPRSGVQVPFTLTVPVDAAPGDHTGGIVASAAVPAVGGEDKKVVVDNRVGARVYVRVQGPTTPSLVIDDVAVTHASEGGLLGRGAVQVRYTVRNAGNVRVAGSQNVSVQGPFGLGGQERALDDIPELLPGSTYTRTETFTDVASMVRITGAVVVTPRAATGNDEAPPEAVERTASTWAIPWLLVALLVIVVGVLLVLRRRRARRPPQPEELPGGSSPVGAAGAAGPAAAP